MGWLDVERDDYGRDPTTESSQHTNIRAENTQSPVENTTPPLSFLDSDRLTIVAELVGKGIDASRQRIPHAKFAQIATLAYEMDTDDEPRLRTYIAKLVKLAS